MGRGKSGFLFKIPALAVPEMLYCRTSMKKGLTAIALVLALSACHRNASSPGIVGAKQAAPPAVSSSFTPATGSGISASDVNLLEQINRENVKVINSALPSLARISATVAIDPRSGMSANPIRLPFPFDRRPSNHAQLNETAYGAGVIIKKDGYIVTNCHVVENAHDVQVQLQDHRVFPATIVASDPDTDVAILKIEANDLKPMPWGDSDKVRVGEQVFAMGNPFDLGASVSRGIISATGRNIPEPSPFQDFLQTDAAINPGNSGGALINIHGELIGLNIEIASTTGADRGVGFALPSNFLRYAVSSLLEHGKLVRGFLGVAVPTMVDEGVLSQLGLGMGDGALLAGIYPHSPAEQAKLQLADFITEIDGHKVSSVSELEVIAAQLPVGKLAEVKYIRNGERKSTFLRVASMPGAEVSRATPFTPAVDVSEVPSSLITPGAEENVLSGLQVTNLNDDTRKKFQVDDWIPSGVVVMGVQANSAAESRGFAQGDVIEMACVRHASPERLSNVRDLTSVAAALKPDQGIALLVHRGRTNRFLYLGPLK